MIVKNNYNECITNLACSIRKYFGLEYKHNTLDYIDVILEEYRPKNIVTILCDGMGSNIIDKVLNKDSFLIKNRIKPITTVFPATTVAATTSMLTGLNPVETGMLGWDMYFKDIDKTISTFIGSVKGDPNHTPLSEAIEYRNKHMITKRITEEIQEVGKYQGYGLFPFGENHYDNVDDMYTRIKEYCQKEGRKYIYAYDEEPDSSMHMLGTYHEKVIDIIKNINEKVEKLSNELKDTIIFVVADHGHISIENIRLKEYPDIIECLSRTTSIEPRAVNFFIKPDKKEEFVKLFNQYFNEYFDLYPKNEVIESKLFGDGDENEIFRDALGDYLAIAKSNKTLIYGNQEFLSHHAGYTEDEILVPLIMVKTRKK